MSQQTADPVQEVRIPLAGRETRRRRTLDERIIVRFPALARRLGAAWAGLPRHSRLRRMILARRVRQYYAAANRRDFDLLVTGYDPAVEYHPAELFPDPDPTYHGHDGIREVWRVLLDAFQDVRLDAEELLDLGDRVLVTTKLNGHGTGSGVSISQPLFQLFTVRRGLAHRQHDFLDRAEALEAAGLSE
jgi:ketosteroid isomerase-like protein